MLYYIVFFTVKIVIVMQRSVGSSSGAIKLRHANFKRNIKRCQYEMMDHFKIIAFVTFYYN